MKVAIGTALAFAFLLILPVAHAGTSEISFIGVTSTYDVEGSHAVAIDGDSMYLASGYQDHVIIMDLENQSVLATIDVDRTVETLEFSHQGQFLAIALSGSQIDSDTIQIYDLNTMSLTEKQSSANAFPKGIAWSPDDNLLAVPNPNNGVDLLRISDMEIERSLSGGHNTDVSCIDFTSNGGHILTGDKSGRILMWNADGSSTNKQWEMNSEIASCAFDPTDTRVASLTVAGQLNTMSFAGGALQNATFDGGSSLSWSSNGAYIHFLEHGTSPIIQSLDASTFELVESTYMAHASTDLSYQENQLGLIEKAFLSTDTQHIAIYGNHAHPYGYGEAGADLDGDKIPDSLDDDDDGDAISDIWDNYCQDTGNMEDCARLPQEDRIRNVEFAINATHFTITDRIYLDIGLSSAIRNLSRIAIIDDLQLSQEETDLFAQSTCANTAHELKIQQWSEAITLSEGQLSDGDVTCNVHDGMTLTAQNDFKSHIGFEYIITFNISSPPTYPMVISVAEQPVATDASLTHLAEMHPIAMNVDAKNAEESPWVLWWNVDGVLELQLQPAIEEKKPLPMTVLGIFIDYPIMILPVLALFLAIGIGALRTKNSMGMDLDIFDEETDEDAEESDIEDDDDQETNAFDEDSAEEDDSLEMEDPPSETTTKPRPESKVRSLSSKEQRPVARRRSRTTSTTKEGPITSVKRKRLDGKGEQTAKKTTTRKKAVSKPPVRKTRRVVTYADKVDEDSPSEP